MRGQPKHSVRWVALFLLPLLLTKRMYAMAVYIDPGSGLLMLQTIGSVCAAGLFYFRRKIASIFRRNHSGQETELPGEVSPPTAPQK